MTDGRTFWMHASVQFELKTPNIIKLTSINLLGTDKEKHLNSSCMEWTDKAIALKVTLFRGMNLRGQILKITLVHYKLNKPKPTLVCHDDKVKNQNLS